MRESISEGNSISVIIGRTNRLYISYNDNKMHKICKITADDTSGEIVDGTYITNIDLGESQEIERNKLLLNQNVQAWGLVLPLLNKNGRYKYYVITDD